LHRVASIQAVLNKFAAPCCGDRWLSYAANLSPENKVRSTIGEFFDESEAIEAIEAIEA
jgi:hypothetical protein